jgi:ABC-2 type transport system ATP-binding protein
VDPVKIEGLEKVYLKGLRRQRVLAVNDLHLSAVHGEIFGFLGPNGAGKSTTIKILCDLIRPTKGKATILGKDVRNPEARREMGYLPENPSYYPFLTAWELLRFHGAIHGVSESTVLKRGEELLHLLELTAAANRPLRTYSKGMVQRLGISAALIHDPRVLILDEPMSGLDPVGRKLVMDLMIQLRTQGKSMFFSTHILHDVEIICDRIGIINQGELKFCGTLKDIASESFSSYEVVFRNVEPHQVPTLQQEGLSSETHQDKVQVEVAKEELTNFLENCMQQGMEPYTVEPKRFSLEDFFMDFIDD